MTTTTIGTFKITHIGGVVKMLTEDDEMIVGASACRLALAAATEIERLRTEIFTDALRDNEAQLAWNLKEARMQAEIERLRAEIKEQKIPCCDTCGNPYVEEHESGNQCKCGAFGCPREADGEWYSGVSYAKNGRELAVLLVKRVRAVVDERHALSKQITAIKSKLAASIAAQEKMRRVGNLMSNVCYNLAQHTSTKREHVATMDELRREWDLVRLAASQPHAGDGEGG